MPVTADNGLCFQGLHAADVEVFRKHVYGLENKKGRWSQMTAALLRVLGVTCPIVLR